MLNYCVFENKYFSFSAMIHLPKFSLNEVGNAFGHFVLITLRARWPQLTQLRLTFVNLQQSHEIRGAEILITG